MESNENQDSKVTSFQACLKGWEVKDIIGSGTWGKVYKVCKDNCKYVVKVTELSSEKDALQFLQEAEITSYMSEKDIAPKVYEYKICETEKGKFGLIVMEKMSKGISEFQTPGGLIPAPIVKIIKTMVKKMHSLGIAHLDLKKQNIMATSNKGDFIVRIIDWGFAVKIGQQPPLTHIDTNALLAYYPDIYGDDCFTQKDVKMLKEKLRSSENKNWNPVFIDKAFLCYLDKMTSFTSDLHFNSDS